jgi:hypothetical protein
MVSWPKVERIVLMELGLDGQRSSPDWEVASRYKWDPKDAAQLLGLTPEQIDAASAMFAEVSADGRKLTWAMQIAREQGMNAVQTQEVIAAAVREGQRLLKEGSVPGRIRKGPPPPPKKAKANPLTSDESNPFAKDGLGGPDAKADSKPEAPEAGPEGAPFGEEASASAKAEAMSGEYDEKGRNTSRGAHDRYKDLKGKAGKLGIDVKGDFEHGTHDHRHLDALEQQIGKHALDRTDAEDEDEEDEEEESAGDSAVESDESPAKNERVRGHSAPEAPHDVEALGNDIHDSLDKLHGLERRAKGGPFWAAYQFVMKEGDKAAKSPSPEALEFTKRRIEAVTLLITGGEGASDAPPEAEAEKSIRLDLRTGRLLIKGHVSAPERPVPPLPQLARDLGDSLGVIGVAEDGVVRLIGDVAKSRHAMIVPDDFGGGWVHPSDGLRLLDGMNRLPRITLGGG